MRVLILSCSLNNDSRSALAAKVAVEHFASQKVEADLIDLREYPTLPFADGGEAHGHAMADDLRKRIAEADAILMAVPIYNFDVNAAAKNLIELTGKVWRHKTVGFICAAGGWGSYMSIMPLANSLMLDFRCLIVPSFVYLTGKDVDATGQLDQAVRERVAVLCDELVELGRFRSQNSAS